MKQNFQKNKVFTGKTPLFVIGPFCTPYSVCLKIGFWQGSFVWKCRITILVLSTKNGTPVLWKKFSLLRKFVSK